jgi:hypothetical protein
VELHRYEDSLEITQVEPLIDYVQSTVRMPIDTENLAEFRRLICQEIQRHGAVRIAKCAGVFEARAAVSERQQ